MAGDTRAVKVAVIIPYFQRERGILERAVASIAVQRLGPNVSVSILIVDDGSPSPARLENVPPLPPHVDLVIIEQENGGVGAARNKGLDSVPADVDFIAFIDSDDEWLPDHLGSALEAMANGADFYFDNNIVFENVDYFSYYRFMREKHGRVDIADRSIHYIQRDEAFNAVLRECLPHTSQVVFSAKAHCNIRFETRLKRAGEDHIFWLTVVGQAKLVGYSMATMGRRGEGISIYRDTLAWDSPNVLSRLTDELVMREIIRSHFSLSRSQLEVLSADQRKVFQHYAFLCLRNRKTQSRQVLASLGRLNREFPRLWLLVPGALLGMPGHVKQLRLERAGRGATSAPGTIPV